MIELTNVSKTFRKHTAIKNLTCSLPVGKIIGIVGNNGSGKSTLLKLMAGLLQPTSGRVTVNGDIASRKTSAFVSYLSDHESSYSMFTIKEAFAFQASQFPDFNLIKAEEIRSYMRLNTNEKIRDLSRGNLARLKIVLTLAREVPYILMDEPLSGLDPMARQSIVKGMISFLDLESQTLVMTSHEITEIESILDSFIAIKEGSLIRMADIEELYEVDGMGITEWMNKTYV